MRIGSFFLAALAATQVTSANYIAPRQLNILSLLLTVLGGGTLTNQQLAALCAQVDPDGTVQFADLVTTLISAVGGATVVATLGLAPTINTVATQLGIACPLLVVTTTTTTEPPTTSLAPTTSSVVVTTTSAPSSSINTNTLPSTTAPTSSGTVVTSSTVSSASSTASPAGAAFVLSVNTGVLRRRQASSGYIAADGSLVSNCASAAQFTLTTSGQLSSGGGLVSTDGTVSNALFVASNPPLNINTLFSGNPLAWTNSAFSGGSASFCVLNNQVYSVFQTAPAGCVAASLTQVSAASCVNTNGGGNGGAGNVTNNIIYNGDVYSVNGSIYNNSFNDNGNGNVAVDGDNNNVNTGFGNSIDVGQMVNIKKIIPSSVWDDFDSGKINYYCSDDEYYYAKFCSSCQVTPVKKYPDDSKCYYVDVYGATQCVPSFKPGKLIPAPPCPGQETAECGTVVYADSYCVDKCKPVTSAPAPPPPATTTCDTTPAPVAPTYTPPCETCEVVPFTGAGNKVTAGGASLMALFGLFLL